MINGLLYDRASIPLHGLRLFILAEIVDEPEQDKLNNDYL
jgi:hypothetical protein